MLFMALAAMASPAFAQDGALDLSDGGDTAWVLGATLLGFLATLPGLVLFTLPQARGRNYATYLYQCGAVALLACLLWIVTGYTLAFGTVTHGWLGSGNAWMLIELGNLRAGTGLPESAFVLCEMACAALAPTLVVGALIGRANTAWLLVFTGLWSLVVYAPIAHWVWGGGWLAASVRVEDWGGGIVIETTAGLTALTLAAIIGPRRQPTAAPVPLGALLSLLGAFFFLIGRTAQGGALALTANDDAAAAMIATFAAAASGGLTCVLLGHWGPRGSGLFQLGRGMIAGLAAIAPAAGLISPGAAIVLGILGALAARAAAGIRRSGTIDDAGDVFALFATGGIVGTLALGLLLSPALGGVGYAARTTMTGQVLAQAIGLAVCGVWTLFGTVVLATMTSLVLPMRVSLEREQAGLDALSDPGPQG
ncbi:ammonium transporter [Novosphingobium sp. 1949]|uniref:Ammonium transporter n=1 Tax=Novosphingobium organovorum TaxID=2930092 RepID=A0ABT0B817_9SPHN|nr:ammonium transporter [Novosphingobium organovorum]MCJ2181153.1 ammonium transporter [Novosphingobium organovorum]